MFRDQGADRLRQEAAIPDDERHLKLALQREKKFRTAERLTELGMERAQHWGFTNTCHVHQSIGDQLRALAWRLPESERKRRQKAGACLDLFVP